MTTVGVTVCNVKVQKWFLIGFIGMNFPDKSTYT